MRGEQEYAGREKPVAEGSPPLARGTEYYAKIESGEERITPACAGNRTTTRPQSGIGKDHPRLRGEQIAGGLADLTREGSPPLARGTVRILEDNGTYVGITPACAGNRLRATIHRR